MWAVVEEDAVCRRTLIFLHKFDSNRIDCRQVNIHIPTLPTFESDDNIPSQYPMVRLRTRKKGCNWISYFPSFLKSLRFPCIFEMPSLCAHLYWKRTLHWRHQPATKPKNTSSSHIWFIFGKRNAFRLIYALSQRELNGCNGSSLSWKWKRWRNLATLRVPLASASYDADDRWDNRYKWVIRFHHAISISIKYRSEIWFHWIYCSNLRKQSRSSPSLEI